MNYKQAYNDWLNDDYFDLQTKKELQDIKDDEKEIEDRFYKCLEFGTGGLRGIIGAGTNRINKYTVSKATQGFANYLLAQENYNKEKGVAIGYDCRLFSEELATITALVLNANGIKTYLFDELRPTPMISFAVRELKCIGGVVITASHNPPEYNGYKVYGEDGGQILFPKDKEVISYVNAITDFKQIKIIDKKEAIEKGLFHIIGEEIDNKYDENVLNQLINKDIIKKIADKLKIVYTPIHGTGNKPVRRILEKAGFKNVIVVKEQEEPDHKFPTVKYPNPEDKNVFNIAIELAKKESADIIIGNDPDADRVGCVVKNNNGDYFVLSGNMIAVLLIDYILSQKMKKGQLNEKSTIISTIVSSDMVKKIAKEYNVQHIETLIGFKFIAEKMRQFEDTHKNEFIFGFEESYGYLTGTYVRDKDGVVSSMLICEMVAYYKDKGLTLYEVLQNLYKKYGYFKDDIGSLTLGGIDGTKKIQKIMSDVRENPFKKIGDINVTKILDYSKKEIIDLKAKQKIQADLPKSNALYFELEDNSWFCIRPSGTEPKIKVYFEVQKPTEEDAKKTLESLVKKVMYEIEKMIK